MSDTATIESSTEAVADVADAAAPSVLGSGMAYRARSQSVLGRHWSPSGVVGAVGRASVGFGLAVGRSRSIRPTVRFDDLNSAALRPSFDVWRRQRTGDADVDDGQAGEMTPVVRSAPIEHRPTVRTPGAAVRTSDAAVRRSTERLRRHPQRRPRPTWTDQIIQRSSIGFVASAPGSAVPVSPLPADFVPSGDAKLDQLRLLMRQREEGADRGTTTAERATSRAGTKVPDSGADQTVLRRTTAAEPTVSVAADGPGRLARALRPESALAPTVPQARLGEPPAPAGSASSPDVRTVASVAQRAAAPGRPATRSRRSAEPPSRLEQLRAALIQQGLLTDGTDDVVGESLAGNDNVAARSDGTGPRPGGASPVDARSRADVADRGEAPRSSSTVADLQRAVTSEGRRPNRNAAPGVDASATPRSTAPDSAPSGPATSAPRADLSSQTPASAGSLDATTTPAATGDRSPGAVALAERATATATTATAAAPPLPVTSSPPASPLASSPVGPAPVTSRPAHQLRAQRLLRSGLAPEPSFSDESESTADFGDSPAVQRQSVDVVAEAVPTNATIDRVVPSSLPTLMTRPALGIVADRPALTRVDSSPATVVRRVTLPRALSSTHRPAPQLPIADVRTVSGTARTPAQVSAVTLGEAQSAARAETADAGVAGAASSAPASSAVAQARVGALLEVVRRSAVTDRAASPTGLPKALSASSPTFGQQNDRGASSTVFTADESVVGARSLSPGAHDAATVVPPTRHRAVDTDIRRSADAVPSGRATDQVSTEGAGDAGRPVRPAERVAEQFMTELSATIRRRPAPLPTTYRPLADAIAGPRPVMLSTDAASRRALRSVGKVAATTGDTIHLDRQAIPTARLDEVMAHELTHIAHPSPTPRFFDDLDDSPEERKAEHVGRIMARSPMAPSASIVTPVGPTSAAPRARTGVVRRMPAATSPSSSDTLSASALAARLSSGSPSPSGSRTSVSAGDRSDTIRRSPSPSTGAPTTPAIQRVVDESSSGHDASMSKDQFVDLFRDNLSEIMNLIEDRMLIELERRGGRIWGAL